MFWGHSPIRGSREKCAAHPAYRKIVWRGSWTPCCLRSRGCISHCAGSQSGLKAEDPRPPPHSGVLQSRPRDKQLPAPARLPPAVPVAPPQIPGIAPTALPTRRAPCVAYPMRPLFAVACLVERASATRARCLGTAPSATNASASGAAPSSIADRADGGWWSCASHGYEGCGGCGAVYCRDCHVNRLDFLIVRNEYYCSGCAPPYWGGNIR